MDKGTIEQLALSLIAEHMPHLGYAVKFDNAVGRLGACDYRKRMILLSEPQLTRADERVVRDTILHEIAHALAPLDGHGAVWRATARRIGAKPQASTREGADLRGELAPWVGVCAAGHVGATRFWRRPRNRRSCVECGGNRFDSRYLLTYSRVDKVSVSV